MAHTASKSGGGRCELADRSGRLPHPPVGTPALAAVYARSMNFTLYSATRLVGGCGVQTFGGEAGNPGAAMVSVETMTSS